MEIPLTGADGRRSSILGEINPFLPNNKIGAYEWIKVVIMSLTMIPVIRLLLMVVILVTTALWAKLCLIGFKQRPVDGGPDQPMARFRRFLLLPVRISFRVILFICGFYWINSSSPRERQPNAPVMVLNHVGLFDALYFLVWDFPMVAVKDEIAGWPLIGWILQSLQPILVPRDQSREGASARFAVANTITDRTRAGVFPPLLIFPEGTCTTGKAIITFKTGAFRPGLPVQPVCISYPCWSHEQGWTASTSTIWLLYRNMCQVFNRMRVDYLPVYTPSEAEQQDADLFASNVREQMAAHMGVPVTRHSVEDFFLIQQAERAHITVPSDVRMTEFQQKLHTNVTNVLELLKRFQEMDKSHDGLIDIEEFARGFGLNPADEATHLLFHLMDPDDSGTIDFREFVLGMLFQQQSDAVAHRQKLELAFAVFDRDGNRSISRKEFRKLLAFVSPDTPLAAIEERERAIYAQFDLDHDEQLSFEEFSAAVERFPEYLQHAQAALNSKSLIFPTPLAPVQPHSRRPLDAASSDTAGVAPAHRDSVASVSVLIPPHAVVSEADSGADTAEEVMTVSGETVTGTAAAGDGPSETVVLIATHDQ